MLMKEELAQLVIEGKKTQTRRPSKPGETLAEINGMKTVLDARGRVKYQVGREYALQYGRGMPTRVWDAKKKKLYPYVNYQDLMAIENGLPLAEVGLHPLKIKLLDVWAEDVRGISEHDAIAEGFEDPEDEDTARWRFMVVWTGFYDKFFNKRMKTTQWIQSHELMARPAELYQAWALKFEVLKP